MRCCIAVSSRNGRYVCCPVSIRKIGPKILEKRLRESTSLFGERAELLPTIALPYTPAVHQI